ncbi:MAG: hypothetical protein AB7D39_15555 [Pseudodesulfovibrio sp.]|uniref:hypothetical protein n=1 Tax=Pseudodesulfovibrio sp. TaxID=2035812 RepID=UPI003D0A1860
MKVTIAILIIAFILWLAAGEGRGQKFFNPSRPWRRTMLALVSLGIITPLLTVSFWGNLAPQAGLGVVLLLPIWLIVLVSVAVVAYWMSSTTFKWFLAVFPFSSELQFVSLF